MNIEDDNIQFEQMPDLDWSLGKNNESGINEKEYDSLYDELLDKCNPSKFKLAGFTKFNVANEIYARLQEMGTGISYDFELRQLRNRAMDELGVRISTTKTFKRLQVFLDPDNFTSRQPYDKELVENAGRLYTQLQQDKDDIRALELLESLPMTARIFEEYEFQKLKPEEYIAKYPEGIHAGDIKEYIAQSLKQKMEEERDCFRNESPSEYLEKYPNGLYSDEADFYLHKGSIAYLKKYPRGRYKESALKDRQGTIIMGVFAGIILVSLILFSIFYA